MSEPIRNKKLELPGAPTPQNTPSQNAPISSHAQEPGVPTIKEEDLERATASSIFATHPKLLNLIEGKLGALIGKSSGYVEGLPAPVRRRVAGLKGIQKEHSKLESAFQEEVLELEKKYFAKYIPLYQKRAQIINGFAEPTEEEVKTGEKDDNNEQKAEDIKPETPEENITEKENVKGIPEFWLSAMKNQISLVDMITPKDEEALKYITDIRMEYLDRPGFRLIFEFAENEFFSNKIITKTYYYQEENGYGGDFIYSHAEGDKIEWATGKDLTVKYESKKQRNKNTKQTRVIKKTIPTDSFFNFFSPPKQPKDDESSSSDIEERLELDYQLGEDIKEKLIPRAIDWFTGEALQFEEIEEEDFDEEFEDEDDEDAEQSDDRDDDEESEEEDENAKPKQEAAECKQS
ncbi:MAG: hypothetical protein M1829_004643 [Trizodia sp. TS-e1964]|nr:MAG: hypothetical protein M1829_004643 [Trizodia sp. TS-e1964]